MVSEAVECEVLTASSAAVLPGPPTATCEVFVAGNHRLFLKGSAHRVIPPVEESEYGNGRNDLDDLLLASVLAQIFE